MPAGNPCINRRNLTAGHQFSLLHRFFYGFNRRFDIDHHALLQALGRVRADTNYLDITVETDLHSNFGFYEHYGFVRLGVFDSPMTRLFAGDQGDTFVYVLDL